MMQVDYELESDDIAQLVNISLRLRELNFVNFGNTCTVGPSSALGGQNT